MSSAATGPWVIAHRGASGYRPEHTAEAYLLAVALGADAVEPDVVATADGVLVVRHENEISGTTDVSSRPEFAGRRTTKEVDGREETGWFTEDFTWEELSTLRARERLPDLRPTSASFDGRLRLLRLADVLILLEAAAEARPVRVVVEVKHPTYFRSVGLPMDELLDRELQLAGRAASPAWLTVESFEKTFLEQVACRRIASRRVYLAEDHGAAFDLVARDGAGAASYAEELTPAGLEQLARLRSWSGHVARTSERLLDAVSVNKSLIIDNPGAGSALVRRAHEVGLDVFCWALRPENRFLSASYRRGASTMHGRWEEEFAAIMRTGVDAVFADHPDLAVRSRDQAG